MHVLTAETTLPDTYLDVLGVDLYVHSKTLKEKSKYFEAFLDSPDKATKPSTRAGYKYTWVSMIDEDGSWYLVAADSKTEPCDLSKLEGNKGEHVSNFYKLVCAMYGAPFDLNSDKDLAPIIELADFYQGKPALSAAIDGLLDRGQLRVTEFTCPFLVGPALKLRHAKLFRECIVYLAGNWSIRMPYNPRAFGPKIFEIVRNCMKEITRKKEYLDASLKEHLKLYPWLAEYMSAAAACEATDTPAYYNTLWSMIKESTKYDQECLVCALAAMEELLGDKTELRFNKFYRGEELYNDFYLSSVVEDGNLPWDPTQEDW
ncbi:uncharacterized protein LY89DRAFT_713290 [Mollisia scopiformis]|uniref:BTB domain-containing protein n=1 Tax=Mollisia scopiformis TaxID=149040 RepID=A0A194XWC2_MOLSC|nr:uncharacterized protein LY89DRAFT_713290 [Mollisia scopiformis]KUJ24436.1 hypothetical protein LY89DRAFT_713290 [Mollisia scopiformis]